jgi:hypothetical protein
MAMWNDSVWIRREKAENGGGEKELLSADGD